MWGTGWAQAGEGGAEGRGWESCAPVVLVEQLSWELQAHSRGLGQCQLRAAPEFDWLYYLLSSLALPSPIGH